MRHSWPDRFLFLEAMLRLALARLMLVALPFHTVARRLGTPASSPAGREASRFPAAARTPPDQPPGRRRSAASDAALLQRIRWALLAAARRAPWRCQCLEQSLAGKMMLRARGIPATLYLGVEKRGDALRAHAWVRSGDVFIAGGDGSTRYSIVSVLG
jgi:hypothetical protein